MGLFDNLMQMGESMGTITSYKTQEHVQDCLREREREREKGVRVRKVEYKMTCVSV